MKEPGKDYRSVRKRLAKALDIPEALSVLGRGLYIYHYGAFLMVRIYGPNYKHANGRREIVFEERASPKDFPTDELVARLMLAAR